LRNWRKVANCRKDFSEFNKGKYGGKIEIRLKHCERNEQSQRCCYTNLHLTITITITVEVANVSLVTCYKLITVIFVHI